MRCETGPEEDDQSEAPLGDGHNYGQEAAPRVEAVGVGNGGLCQAVTIKCSFYSKTGKNCGGSHY